MIFVNPAGEPRDRSNTVHAHERHKVAPSHRQKLREPRALTGMSVRPFRGCREQRFASPRPAPFQSFYFRTALTFKLRSVILCYSMIYSSFYGSRTGRDRYGSRLGSCRTQTHSLVLSTIVPKDDQPLALLLLSFQHWGVEPRALPSPTAACTSELHSPPALAFHASSSTQWWPVWVTS